MLEEHRDKGQILTGIIHLNEAAPDTHDILETPDTPLNALTQKDLCPGNRKLQDLMDTFR